MRSRSGSARRRQIAMASDGRTRRTLFSAGAHWEIKLTSGEPPLLARVQVDDIERIRPQVSEVVVDGTREVRSGERGNPRCVRAAHRADLGHAHKVIGIGMKRLANELVGYVRAIVIAGVDVVHAPRDRLAKHAEGRVSILWRAEHAWSGQLHRPVAHAVHGAVAQRENASGSDVGYVSLHGLISDARLS